MTKKELLLLLDLAVGEPIGLLLRCSSAEKARAAGDTRRAEQAREQAEQWREWLVTAEQAVQQR